MYKLDLKALSKGVLADSSHEQAWLNLPYFVKLLEEERTGKPGSGASETKHEISNNALRIPWTICKTKRFCFMRASAVERMKRSRVFNITSASAHPSKVRVSQRLLIVVLENSLNLIWIIFWDLRTSLLEPDETGNRVATFMSYNVSTKMAENLSCFPLDSSARECLIYGENEILPVLDRVRDVPESSESLLFPTSQGSVGLLQTLPLPTPTSQGEEHILARDFNEFSEKLIIFLEPLEGALKSLLNCTQTLKTLWRDP
ncbi:uncharacterized protein LOC124242719 [Equus quagga]|uniref:uncharacterized protein LOC124242719 n=1 Tax=Equus quagga TaxID=89248 RepID=UPI001EE24AC6|nr:uncharacterized protein LOC124242719 [Equus quagga]